MTQENTPSRPPIRYKPRLLHQTCLEKPFSTSAVCYHRKKSPNSDMFSSAPPDPRHTSRESRKLTLQSLGPFYFHNQTPLFGEWLGSAADLLILPITAPVAMSALLRKVVSSISQSKEFAASVYRLPSTSNMEFFSISGLGIIKRSPLSPPSYYRRVLKLYSARRPSHLINRWVTSFFWNPVLGAWWSLTKVHFSSDKRCTLNLFNSKTTSSASFSHTQYLFSTSFNILLQNGLEENHFFLPFGTKRPQMHGIIHLFLL